MDQRGAACLAAGGPDAVRIVSLAATLGVTKDRFDGYFGDRSAFLDEMLDAWERMSVSSAAGPPARHLVRRGAGRLLHATGRHLRKSGVVGAGLVRALHRPASSRPGAQ